MAISAHEIRDLRSRLGLTQAELADELCLSREAIAAWETGRNGPTGPARMLLRQLEEKAKRISSVISENFDELPHSPIDS